MQQLLNIFPFIKQTMLELEKQNKFLNKVTLTGKINALHVAANLFEFTDKTAIVFDELKIELINALLKENINKVTNELNFKAKTAIDILIRNLFERTADVGFFSTDSLIIDFLSSDTISKEEIQNHLKEYASKYSVYNEIVIFDTAGNATVNLNRDNALLSSSDPIIQEALHSDTYIEKYAYTNIFKAQKRTLLYAQKITHNGQNIGVLCLCFKFDDELRGIFEKLATNNDQIALLDNSSILASNGLQKHLKYSEEPYQINKQGYVIVTTKASSYQGYSGVDSWFAASLHKANTAPVQIAPQEDEEQSKQKEPNLKLLSEELNLIIQKANAIIEDIADVIINGELIASKQKVYLLTPILDNLRNISTELLNSIKGSIRNLEDVVKEGLVHDVKMASHLAIDIMDRNLYERANDSRWWALTPLFKTQLAKEEPDREALHKTLLSINELYTVYTNIFLFDTTGKIISASHDTSIVGEILEDEYIQKTLSNKDSQKYFVSPFEKSSFYNNEATYIYSASIVNSGKTVGGIAVVFDAITEFEAMLNDSFPSSQEGFMLFCDRDKKVISSNNPDIPLSTTLDLEDCFFQLQGKHAVSDFITFQKEEYVIASVLSQGYREYKTSDNYKNDTLSITFVKV